MTIDSRGRPVSPALLPNRIPGGYLYLGVPELTTSFDSRYLGLVQMRELVRTIRPLGFARRRLGTRSSIPQAAS
jgi:type IV secretory pathway protease TraF